MRVFGCDMVEIFASESLSFGKLTNQQPLFLVNEITFPNIEELKLERNDSLRKIWHGQIRAVVFSQLRVLELLKFSDEAVVFPHCFIQSLPNLEKLVVSEAPFRQIFNLEGFDGNEIDALPLTSLNELRLAKLPQLTHLLEEDCICSGAFRKVRTLAVLHCGKLKNLVPSWVSFEDLTCLELSSCDGLVNLISCSTAKSLVQLTRMSITDCDMIGEIIAVEGDELKGCIVFTNLKCLQLSCLPSLACFCLGKHNFEFPVLEKVSVIGRPKLKIFSHGDLSTPMLQRVQFIQSEDEGCWEGNLKLFTQKVGYRGLEGLKLFDSSELVEIWRRNPQGVLDFKSLKSVEVDDCSTLRFLFSISVALNLAQLGEIKVKNCTMMKHIIVDEGPDEEVKNKIVFPLLNSIFLKSCGDLANFYQGSKLLEFPSLKEIKVVDCPQMFAFASTFSREQRIETIADGENTSSLSKGAGDSFAAAFFNNTVECHKLGILRLSSVNIERIWDDQLPDMSWNFQNLKLVDVEGCHNLRCLSSSSMMPVQLQNIQIKDCANLEEVIFVEGAVAEDSVSHIFPKLSVLGLKNLPKLMRFCCGSYLEFPLLKWLHIGNCPTFTTFISDSKNAEENSSDIDFPTLFSEKVVFPQLEYLRIERLGNCRKIWHNLLVDDSFSKLDRLFVFDIDRLLNVFPINMSKRLQNLQELQIFGCDSLEEIFESLVLNANEVDALVTASQSIVEETITNFIFPKLTFLELRRLPRLKSFYSRIHTTEWPLLKRMLLNGCYTVAIFASGSIGFGELTNQQPLFWVNEVAFPQLEELIIDNFRTCRKIWHHELAADSFSKLKIPRVSHCHRLVNVFPFNMNKNLQNLEDFRVAVCDSLEEIIEPRFLSANELHAMPATQSIMEETTINFVFPKLTYLEFAILPRLRSFYSGIHTTEWPSLTKMRIHRCDMVDIFASESLSFGELANQQSPFCVNEIGYRGLKHLKLIGSSRLMEIWTRNPQGILNFTSLKSLEVYHCSTLRCLFTLSMVLNLAQLYELKVKGCIVMEHIIIDEGPDEEVKNQVVFPLLSSIILESCGLASFYQGSKILECPSLKKLKVDNCPQMFAFAST